MGSEERSGSFTNHRSAITTTQQEASASALTPSISSFPFISVAEYPPPICAALICIGHPRSEDLEVSRPGIKMGYDLLHISTGCLVGLHSSWDEDTRMRRGISLEAIQQFMHHFMTTKNEEVQALHVR